MTFIKIDKVFIDGITFLDHHPKKSGLEMKDKNPNSSVCINMDNVNIIKFHDCVLEELTLTKDVKRAAVIHFKDNSESTLVGDGVKNLERNAEFVEYEDEDEEPETETREEWEY